MTVKPYFSRVFVSLVPIPRSAMLESAVNVSRSEHEAAKRSIAALAASHAFLLSSSSTVLMHAWKSIDLRSSIESLARRDNASNPPCVTKPEGFSG